MIARAATIVFRASLATFLIFGGGAVMIYLWSNDGSTQRRAT